MNKIASNGNIRPVKPADLDDLKIVLDTSGLFPSEYLDEMIAAYFKDPETAEIWFTYLYDGRPVAIGYCVPEKLTEGTYNLLSIAVAPEFQGKGIARAMMAYIEQLLRGEGGRILIVETSSDDRQSGARALYRNLDYTQMAVIQDFWKDGEDKIVFWKRL